jgi:MoaA/NifB/PqqE/SkfB family radical SAM enzyme
VGHCGEPRDQEARALLRGLARLVTNWESRGADRHLQRYLELPRGVVATGESLEVRVTVRCNEACPFCSTPDASSTLNAAASPEEVEALLDAAPGLGVRLVTLTGGEPTLCPELPGWIRRIHDLGLQAHVQTNAVRLADPASWATFVGADGRVDLPDQLLVSLHTQHAERLPELVGVPGASLDRKLAAVRGALERHVPVQVNFVLSALNVDEVDAFPDFLARTFPTHVGALQLMFSFATPHGRMEQHRHLWPRVPDVAPRLARALERAEALGLAAFVPDTCGLPPCVLPDHARFFWTATRAPAGAAVTYERFKWPFCAACRYDERCVGVWRAFAESHGAEGFGASPCVTPAAK